MGFGLGFVAWGWGWGSFLAGYRLLNSIDDVFACGQLISTVMRCMHFDVEMAEVDLGE